MSTAPPDTLTLTELIEPQRQRALERYRLLRAQAGTGTGR